MLHSEIGMSGLSASVTYAFNCNGIDLSRNFVSRAFLRDEKRPGNGWHILINIMSQLLYVANLFKTAILGFKSKESVPFAYSKRIGKDVAFSGGGESCDGSCLLHSDWLL